MSEFRRIKQNYYDYISKYYGYINKWKPYSYRRTKVITYVNVASLLVVLFAKLKIKPNTVTLVYALSGMLGGLLLMLPLEKSTLAAALIFYFCPYLDWADGPLARETNQTSISGDILDSYGARLGWLSLWCGTGVYLGRTTAGVFYIICPLLIFLCAVDIYPLMRERFIYHYFSEKDREKIMVKEATSVSLRRPEVKNAGFIKKLKALIDIIFEINARTIDIVCLLLLLEFFFRWRVLWVYYLGFFLWQAFIFGTRLLILSRGGWAEDQLGDLKKHLYG